MKQKYVWITFIISILVLTPFRIYQKVVLGGKFNNVFGIKKVDLGIVIAFLVFVLLIIIMMILSKDSNNQIKIKKNVSTGVLGIISGILILASSVAEFISTVQIWIENKEQLLGLDKLLKSDERVSEAREFIKSQVSVQNITLVYCIFGVAACVGLIFFAMSSIKGKNELLRFPLLSILPTIWGIFKVIEIFIARSSLVSEQNDVFDTIEAMFLLLFLFTQSKIFVNIKDEKKENKIFYFGFISVLSMMLYNVPNLVALFLRNDVIYGVDVIGYVSSIVLAVYIVFFLVDCGRKNEEEFIYEGATIDLKNDNPELLDPKSNESNNYSEKDNTSESLDVDMLHVNQIIDKIEKSEDKEQ